ncbi:hypothetical protein BJV74DRAFT_367951 [Russula compacta]|nr:hypothetical protein BJV74DRAFT_367951 [Russula compacta]
MTTSLHFPFVTPNPVAGMLAVLCSAPRPPLGVALFGVLITALSLTLRLLPYLVFCSMVVLPLWVPSGPAHPEAVYYPVYGHPNDVYVVYTSGGAAGTDDMRPFELSAPLRILVFVLALPVTSILENMFFRPARDLFLGTVECWFEMRYVQPAQATGSWPDTWTPILNALRSFRFVADFINGVMGNDYNPVFFHEGKECQADMPPFTSKCEGGTPLQMRRAGQKASSSRRTVRFELDHNRAPSSEAILHGEAEA